MVSSNIHTKPYILYKNDGNKVYENSDRSGPKNLGKGKKLRYPTFAFTQFISLIAVVACIRKLR